MAENTPPEPGPEPARKTRLGFNTNLNGNQFVQKLGPAFDAVLLARSYTHKGGLGQATRYMLNRGEGRYGLPPHVRQVRIGEHLEQEGGSGIYGEAGPTSGESG